MSERLFLFLTGACILVALYFDVDMMLYGLCLWLVFEGVSGVTLTGLSAKFIVVNEPVGLTMFRTQPRFNFEALRATRIVIAVVLGGSFLLLNEYEFDFLWFFCIENWDPFDYRRKVTVRLSS